MLPTLVRFQGNSPPWSGRASIARSLVSSSRHGTHETCVGSTASREQLCHDPCRQEWRLPRQMRSRRYPFDRREESYSLGMNQIILVRLCFPCRDLRDGKGWREFQSFTSTAAQHGYWLPWWKLRTMGFTLGGLTVRFLFATKLVEECGCIILLEFLGFGMFWTV